VKQLQTYYELTIETEKLQNINIMHTNGLSRIMKRIHDLNGQADKAIASNDIEQLKHHLENSKKF